MFPTDRFCDDSWDRDINLLAGLGGNILAAILFEHVAHRLLDDGVGLEEQHQD